MLYLRSHHQTQYHFNFLQDYLPGVLLLCILYFWPVIHFELVFEKGVGSVSRFTFFACGCPVIPAPFAERLYFLHCVAVALLSKVSWLYLWNLYQNILLNLPYGILPFSLLILQALLKLYPSLYSCCACMNIWENWKWMSTWKSLWDAD